MDFSDHSSLRGQHAFLSPSNYHWLNYDEQKLKARLTSYQAAARGTRIHSWAHEAINLGMRQARNGNTVNRYINDGIGHRMMTDFVIFVTENAYGEADTLCYRDKVLRIHDLKTGLVKAGITQLEVYAGYFYLEYGLDPEENKTILQIYQNNKIVGGTADPARIRHIMSRTKEQDRLVKEYKREAE